MRAVCCALQPELFCNHRYELSGLRAGFKPIFKARTASCLGFIVWFEFEKPDNPNIF